MVLYISVQLLFKYKLFYSRSTPVCGEVYSIHYEKKL